MPRNERMNQVEPGSFIMKRKMLLGIQARAEQLVAGRVQPSMS